MTVNILINSLGGGGAERQAARIAPEIAGKLIMLETDRVYDPGVEVVALSAGTGRSPAWRKLLRMPLQLVRLARMQHGDAVLSFLVRANLLNVLSGLFARHRAIISERQALSPASRPGLMKLLRLALLGIAYRRADLVVVNAAGTRDELVAWCGIPSERISIVRNACDAVTIRAKGAMGTPGIPASRFVIASGRLVPQKGYDVLLEAFARFRHEEPDTALVILGTGPEEARLRARARELGIAEAVTFAGFQENPFAWITHAEAFVMSSAYEGFPNVILEALALGIPVVSVDCNHGPREILAPDTDHRVRTDQVEDATYGVLVEAGNPEQLARGIARAIERAEELKAAGPERVKEFEPGRIVEDWKRALGL